jgi:hypothetical protein
MLWIRINALDAGSAKGHAPAESGIWFPIHRSRRPEQNLRNYFFLY